jgi:flagellar motor switch protein FliM
MSKNKGEKILTQEEIDALFAAMQDNKSGGDQQTRAKAQKKITKYDMHRHDRISKEHIRSLHLIHDYFQRSMAASLSAYLRAFVELKMVSIEQISYGEFLEYISEPACYNSISMNPMEGNMVLEMSYPAVFPMIDLLLGGTGLPPREERPITDIEWSIIDGVIKLVLRDLKEAWKPVVELDMKVVAHESKPQLLHFVSLSEPVVAICFELRIGNSTGSLNLGIPSILLKLIRNCFEQQWAMRRLEDVTRDLERVRSLVPYIPVDLSVELRGNSIRVRDFLELEAGDVIGLAQAHDKPVLIAVEGTPRFTGQVVRCQDRRGIVVTDLPTELEMQL